MSNREEPFVDESVETVVARRVPRYWRFLALGAALGVVIALILTFAFPDAGGYSRLQTFGYLALVAGPTCAALAAVVALVVEARARRVTVPIERDRIRITPDSAVDESNDQARRSTPSS